MIKIENVEVVGWEATMRGMRNPKNSWDRSDSGYNCSNIECEECEYVRLNDSGEVYGCTSDPHHVAYMIGPNDHDLAMRLAKGGPVHAKYRRFIDVYLDITAPLYWWKEFDTYKVGTVANSCSTMHKIHDKKFTVDDFSHEHLFDDWSIEPELTYTSDKSSEDTNCYTSMEGLRILCDILNHHRNMFLETKNKRYWWQMIQLLPTSYNQKRTIKLNYEVLVGMYEHRKNHKLDEWVEFCKWIETLPYSELITGGKDVTD